MRTEIELTPDRDLNGRIRGWRAGVRRDSKDKFDRELDNAGYGSDPLNAVTQLADILARVIVGMREEKR